MTLTKKNHVPGCTMNVHHVKHPVAQWEGNTGLCAACVITLDRIVHGTALVWHVPTRRRIPPADGRTEKPKRIVEATCACGVTFTFTTKNGGRRRKCDKCRDKHTDTESRRMQRNGWDAR